VGCVGRKGLFVGVVVAEDAVKCMGTGEGFQFCACRVMGSVWMNWGKVVEWVFWDVGVGVGDMFQVVLVVRWLRGEGRGV
jgi:hypothetical protein